MPITLSSNFHASKPTLSPQHILEKYNTFSKCDFSGRFQLKSCPTQENHHLGTAHCSAALLRTVDLDEFRQFFVGRCCRKPIDQLPFLVGRSVGFGMTILLPVRFHLLVEERQFIYGIDCSVFFRCCPQFSRLRSRFPSVPTLRPLSQALGVGIMDDHDQVFVSYGRIDPGLVA